MSRTSVAVNVRLTILAVSVVASAACSPPVHVSADPGKPPIVVTLQPDRAWTETGIPVRRGEWLFITATGDVSWDARHTTAGPDGINGALGWYIGAGGLVGSVADTSAPFDIGARTHPFRSKDLRSRREFPPPPIQMKRDGTLLLGFKDFRPGSNRGTFEVTILRSR